MQSMAATMKYDRLAAVPMGGLTLGLALSLTSECPLIYPRPNSNDNTGRYLAGAYKAGETVLLVDDVLSHGNNKQELITLLETVRLRVNDIMVLLDRGLGGKEALEAKGYRIHTILTMNEVLDNLLALHRIQPEQHRFVK